ncbi:MAG: 23S rRNA (guanosine(2251)-2'-O)-methyltransferase RlmB, partial [Eudoraea sp.]|nr:23S rRNA (guanosine(2251)-2'-O)-methyltransferase RlmB [Eudoraea sp.]
MIKDTQIYGLRAVMEAVRAGKDIQKVFLQKRLQGALFKELEGVLRQANIPISYVPYEKLGKLTR